MLLFILIKCQVLHISPLKFTYSVHISHAYKNCSSVMILAFEMSLECKHAMPSFWVVRKNIYEGWRLQLQQHILLLWRTSSLSGCLIKESGWGCQVRTWSSSCTQDSINLRASPWPCCQVICLLPRWESRLRHSKKKSEGPKRSHLRPWSRDALASPYPIEPRQCVWVCASVRQNGGGTLY